MYCPHLVSDRHAWRQYGFRILVLEPRPDLPYATHILCSPHWTPLISFSPQPLLLDSSRPPWFLFLRPHYNALPGFPWRIFSLGLARSCVPGPQTHGCLQLRLSLPLRVSLPGCSQAAGMTLMRGIIFPLMCPPLGHALCLSPIMLEKSGLSLGSQTESLITRFGVFHFCTDCFSYGDPDDFIFNHLKGLLSSFSAFNLYFLLF